ncbi:pYEATS domain-containing protein [Flavobacterium sp. M31R6]|uniref:pYEATS domain-containing protein n=1 Tax=Flavobacterium sp. M31R6 TaxID=2739062 RepID=UPI0015696CD6|nr:pYEATS domain-containing protein [Flavobacterium sp. M31R6]QKJ64741.1 hypothetical protein HQN62_16905 [Flavobacterium sp. M31R6]
MANNETKSLNETELEKEKNTGKEAETSVLLTLYMGLFLGMVPLIGFPITIPEMGGKILFIGLTLGIAAFISSFFLGTLFGMPRRGNKTGKDYALNNGLIGISDWLTKIIVGFILINLKEIPGYINSFAEYIRIAAKYNDQLLNIYTIGILFYFSFLGLFIGYNYMRLVLSNKYKYADDNLIRRELEITKEKLLEAKEENKQKDKKIIEFQSLVHEKEQLVKALIDKVNAPTMSNSNIKAVVKKLVDSDEFKKGNGNIELHVDKMIDEAKMKLHKGLITHHDDPQKGQWKSSAINNERELKATVIEETKGLYKINLQIVSTNPKNNPLTNGDLVLFALHNTFDDPPFKLVKVDKQSAELNFYAYGSFTVGAFVDDGTTELELDLAELPNVSSHFKFH